MSLTQKIFFFQEGQYLAKSTVTNWLKRSSQEKDGLNPPATESMPAEERAKKGTHLFIAYS